MELLQIAKPPLNIDIFSPAVRVEVSRLTRSDRRNPPGKSAIALPYRQSLFAVCLSSGDFTRTFFMRYGYNYGISLLQSVQWDYFIHHAFYRAKTRIPWDYGQRQFSPWALHCQARYELTTIFMYNMVATMYRIKIGFSIAVLVYVSGFTKRSRIFKERTWYGLFRCGQLTTTAVGSLPLACQFTGKFPCAVSLDIPGSQVAQCLRFCGYATILCFTCLHTPHLCGFGDIITSFSGGAVFAAPVVRCAISIPYPPGNINKQTVNDM